MLDDLDLKSFWKASAYARQVYVDEPVTPELVARVEAQLGYRLPPAYAALMKHQNGGIPRCKNHRTAEATSWAPDHVAVSGIFAIGSTRPYSLCGEFSSKFWASEWGYPAIGVYFANCPSAGHDMLCLDYRDCGPEGEPCVVHVDQARDFKITLVAASFESFVRGLEADEAFDSATDSAVPE